MQTFNEFVFRQTREAQKHLEIVKKLLEQNNFKVKDHTKDNDDPFLFVSSPEHNLSFGGIRVYQIGDDIAFRPQKGPENQAYGLAQSLDVQEIYTDLLDEDIPSEKMAETLIHAIVNKLNSFFEKAKEAEQEKPGGILDPLNRAYIRSNGTDYANKVLTNI